MGFNWANRFSLLRMLLVPVFVWMLLSYAPGRDDLRWWAAACFLVAVMTDGIDGYLARRWQQRSELGVILDPIADKTLLLTGFVSLSVLSNVPPVMRLPVWLTLVVVSRDVLIVLGSVVVYLVTGRLRVRPSRLGKVTTVLQMSVILVVLFGWPWREPLWVVTAVATVASGIGYMRYGASLLNAFNSGEHSS